MSAVAKYNGVNAFTAKPLGIDTRKVYDLYTPNQVPLSGLQIYYDPAHPDCYSGSGTTLTDLMGNYNSTINGGMDGSFTQNGWFDNDGVNDGISISSVPLDSLGSLGVGVWFQYAGLTTTQLLIDDYFNNGGGDRYGLRTFYFNNNITFQFTSPSNNPFVLTSILSTNTWYFIYGQTKYNGNNTYTNQLWLGDTNGLQQLVNNPSFSSSPPTTTTKNVPMGITNLNTGGTSWGGKVGEYLRYYNHTLLTNAQVNSIFDNTKKRYGY